jgi:hypothetical protein
MTTPYLPPDYKVSFGIGLHGMGAATNYCDQLLENVATYTRLSNKTDKTKETRQRAAAIAAENQATWNASCSPAAVAAKAAAKAAAVKAASDAAASSNAAAVAKAAADAKALADSQALASAKAIIDAKALADAKAAAAAILAQASGVVGAQASSYITPANTTGQTGVPLPASGTVDSAYYSTATAAPAATVQAAAPVTKISVTECQLTGFPRSYSDLYGAMSVRAIFCGATPAPAAVQQQTQSAQAAPANFTSSDLWS